MNDFSLAVGIAKTSPLLQRCNTGRNQRYSEEWNSQSRPQVKIEGDKVTYTDVGDIDICNRGGIVGRGILIDWVCGMFLRNRKDVFNC
jgi:hypothetical protein